MRKREKASKEQHGKKVSKKVAKHLRKLDKPRKGMKVMSKR